MPRFKVMVGRDVIDTHYLVQDHILIGRSSKADISLDNLMISRRHAEVVRSGRSFVVNNLAGANGLFVNGQWVDTHVLKDGDLVELGKFSIQFEFPQEEREKMLGIDRKEKGAGFRFTTSEALAEIEAGERRAADQQAPGGKASKFADSKADTLRLNPGELAKVRQSMEMAKRAHLIVSTPKGAKTYPVKTSGTTIGKDSDCDIRVYTGWLAPRISAVITRPPGPGYVLETKGGTVTVNGEKCVGTRRLRDKDRIEVDGHKLTFHDSMQK